MTTKAERDQAALLTTIDTQRRAMHQRNAELLLTVLGVFAASIDLISLRLAVDVDAPTPDRKQQATADLTRQANIAGVIPAWGAANRDAQAAAQASGAAAAGHLLTLGDLPVEPDTTNPPPDTLGSGSFTADGRVTDQLSGVGADAAAALADDSLSDDDTLDDEDLIDLLGDSPGADYYLDLMNSRDYMAAAIGVYNALGVTQYMWDTVDDRACDTCEELAARSPYYRREIPEVPHGHCRCFTIPA